MTIRTSDVAARDSTRGYAASAFATLETIITPGKRSRLSPFVEAAQFQMLFGEAPDGRCHVESSKEILRRHAGRVAELAGCWDDFAARGKHFAQTGYSDANFLDTYLAYYFSLNVPKIQRVLWGGT